MDQANQGRIWWVVRIRQQAARKIECKLNELDIEHYIPFRKETIEKEGRRFSVEKVATLNLIFVRTPKRVCEQLYTQMGSFCSPVRCLHTNELLMVPDKQMEDFRFLMDFSQEAVMVLNETLKAGQWVRVIKGPFAGIEGELIRVRGHKRVVVRFEGLFSLATTYIPPGNLEVVNDKNKQTI